MNHSPTLRAALAGAAFLTGTLVGVRAGAGSELERRELATASPQAAALVAQADQAARAGRAKEAWELFGKAWPLAPRSPLPARGICRLSLALGIETDAQWKAARSACQSAMLLGGTHEDLRNKAAADLSVRGALRPTIEDFVSASLAVDGAVRMDPFDVWAYAGRADLGLWLGEPTLVEAARADLRRVAPEHEETRRAEALAIPASAWVWAGRLGLALVLLATAAHAATRRIGQRMRVRRTAPVLATTAALMLTFFSAGPAAATSAGAAAPDTELDLKVQRVLASGDPMALATLLQDLAARAEIAAKRGDHAAVAGAWRAATQLVPERAYGFARLCDVLEAAGKRAEALVACRTAITRQDTTAGDYTHFVKLLVEQDGPLTPSDHRQIDLALAALDKEPAAALIAARVRCNVAVHDHDVPALEACTRNLIAAEPDDVRTVSFQWALARERGDRASAELLAKRVQTLTPAAPTVAASSPGTKAQRFVRWAVAGLAASLAVALLIGGASRLAAARRRRLPA